MKANNNDKYRELLTALAARVGADATNMQEQVRAGSGGNGGAELSNAPFHLGDMGTEEYLYDLNVTLLGNEQYIMAEAARQSPAWMMAPLVSASRAVARSPPRVWKQFLTPASASSAPRRITKHRRRI